MELKDVITTLREEQTEALARGHEEELMEANRRLNLANDVIRVTEILRSRASDIEALAARRLTGDTVTRDELVKSIIHELVWAHANAVQILL